MTCEIFFYTRLHYYWFLVSIFYSLFEFWPLFWGRLIHTCRIRSLTFYQCWISFWDFHRAEVFLRKNIERHQWYTMLKFVNCLSMRYSTYEILPYLRQPICPSSLQKSQPLCIPWYLIDSSEMVFYKGTFYKYFMYFKRLWVWPSVNQILSLTI